MYFDFCYRNDIPRVLDSLAKHRRDPSRFIREFYARRKVGMGDGMTLMFLAMAAFYDPDPKAPLGFHLPMDLRTGEVDERRWSRWLRHTGIGAEAARIASGRVHRLRIERPVSPALRGAHPSRSAEKVRNRPPLRGVRRRPLRRRLPHGRQPSVAVREGHGKAAIGSEAQPSGVNRPELLGGAFRAAW